MTHETETGPAATYADGTPTLATLQALDLPRYRHLRELAGRLTDGSTYPRSYTIDEAIGEHLDRGIVSPQEARWLRELAIELTAR